MANTKAKPPARAKTASKPAAVNDTSHAVAVTIERLRALGFDRLKDKEWPLQAPTLMRGVVPPRKKAPVMAMDYADLMAQYPIYSVAGFPGYPYLSQLATRPEYRAFASTFATEMTRKWIAFTSTSDKETSAGELKRPKAISKKIEEIQTEFERLKVRDLIGTMAAHDCFFGRAQCFVTIKDAKDQLPLVLDPRTVKKGSLERITAVEAIWTTPVAYNSIDPAAPDFYKPTSWFMLGRQVHASRLLTVITRPLPDILKPAFNFGGISLSQLAEPYVDNWIRTRQSISDLINNFSITILKTAMQQLLQPSTLGKELIDRANLFTATRSNLGLMMLDKNEEELDQINTPLSGLADLQEQAQMQMSTVSRIPSVILTGMSPDGLNASSDGELRVFYDWIAAQEEGFWRSPLTTILQLVQLNLYGAIDPTIGFKFLPLYQMTAKELAEIRKSDAEADVMYIDAGVIAPEEARERVAKDPNSGYEGLDLDAVIVPPDNSSDDETVAGSGDE